MRGLKTDLGQEVYTAGVSHPVWGAWIEKPKGAPDDGLRPSHPVWGAWIENYSFFFCPLNEGVAPRVGCVD